MHSAKSSSNGKSSRPHPRAVRADEPEIQPRGDTARNDAPSSRLTIASIADAVLAPLVALGSVARRARLFHPTGTTAIGTASSVAETTAARALAARLAGPVVMRFSGGLWKHREWTDVLGVALRFTRKPIDEEHAPGDQDLLMITARSLWLLPIGALTTDVHDYLANAYYGAAPFELDGLGRCELRLVPRAVPAQPARGADRGERLLDAIARGGVVLELDYRRTGHHGWSPLVEVRPGEGIALDQDRLRFMPFHDVRGIHPVGWVHALRRRTYQLSQAARRIGR